MTEKTYKINQDLLSEVIGGLQVFGGMATEVTVEKLQKLNACEEDEPIVIGKENSLGSDEMYAEFFECPACGDFGITDESNFCPNCGKELIFKDIPGFNLIQLAAGEIKIGDLFYNSGKVVNRIETSPSGEVMFYTKNYEGKELPIYNEFVPPTQIFTIHRKV